MRKKNTIWNYIIIYVFGILTTLSFSLIPSTYAQSLITTITSLNSEQPNTINPQTHFKKEQIQIYQNKVVLNAENIKWAKFEDTNSMLPTINKNSYALQIEPSCPQQINTGDIISYKTENSSEIIIHRVVNKKIDEKGTYFILKGDNNPVNDPEKVRCHQIDRKVVAIIY